MVSIYAREDETGSIPLTLALLAAVSLMSGLIFQVAFVSSHWMALRHEASQLAFQVATRQLLGQTGCSIDLAVDLVRCSVAPGQVEVVLQQTIHTPIGARVVYARAAVGYRFPEP